MVLVGKVSQQFSVIHRAIADSFSLLFIYFVCDPIFNGTRLDNVGLNLVAFIVPLSTATFTIATSEMQKVFNATVKLGRRNTADLSEDSDEMSEISPGGFSRVTRSERSAGSPLTDCSPMASNASPVTTAPNSPDD